MPKLAEIVIETGLADRATVLRAVKIADEEKMPLVAALVRHNQVDELALVAAVKRNARVALVDPAQVMLDPEASRELSRDVCWRLRVVPVSVAVFDSNSKVLRLAMADPTDTVAVAEVEHLTGGRVEGALMPLSAVEELIEQAYRSQVTEVIRRDRTGVMETPNSAPRTLVTELTEPFVVAVDTAEVRAPLPSRTDHANQPSTVPFHRVTDEASLQLKHRALLDILVRKKILTEEEYEEQVRSLMKQRSDDA
ncbi:MAG: hypothetical protein AAGC55_21145 [Myxococcota bacterium]